MSSIATRGDWQAVRYDGPCRVLPYEDTFTAEEFEALQAGVIPESMDDKWFVFYEQPQLFLHRSATGLFVYRVTLAADGDGSRVAEAVMSSELEGSQSVDYEASLLRWILRCVLLAQDDVEFPRLPLA